jgi:curved DNA-binding protein CbpA
MNYKTAFEILEIDMSDKKYSDINLEYLKKQYRKLALKHHPDRMAIHLIKTKGLKK